MPETAFPNLIPALPEIFLAVAAMLLLMIGVFSQGGDLPPEPPVMEALLCSLSPSCLWAWLPKVVFSLSAAHSSRTLLLFSSK